VENLQSVLTDLCERRKIPGAVLGVVVDGEVTVATHGIANLNTGLPVVRDTLFQAGSIGKSYTATAVMQLVDDGSVSLDAPLRDYLPDLTFEDAAVSKTLTARQILAHVAGIDGDRIDDEMVYGRGDDCLERYVAGLVDLPLITEPGGMWSYCNSGYVVLGRLIEVVTGMTFEQAMTTRLLAPLGLTDTLFFPGDMVTHSLAVGHVRDGDADPVVAPKWEMSRAAGAAGSTINTTIDELLAFAQLHLRGGLAADGTRVLSEASVREMQRPHAECPEPELLGDHWGLGWFLRTRGGPTVIGHDGNTHGITSCLRIIPERNAAWGLLMNLSGQNWAGMDVAHAGLDEWLGTTTPGQPEPSGLALSTTNPYVGAYDSAGSRLVVSDRDGTLAFAIEPHQAPEGTPAMEGALFPITDTRFVLRIAALGDDLPVTFMEPAADGRYAYLHMGARAHRRLPE
jgi:CubicO group peptidase (beta-lactamase class C family)